MAIPSIYIPGEGQLDYDFIGFYLDGTSYWPNDPNDKINTGRIFYRVSDGSRFTENLLPAAQDKTVQIPGADGTYYFGTYYTSRDISLSLAFDGIDEGVLHGLRQTMNKREIIDFYTYEAPYKVYKVIPKTGSSIKYMCFNQDEDISKPRVYKGEASLSFICYEPFARTPNSQKYLSYYSSKNKFKTYQQWNATANLKNKGDYDTYNINTGIKLYNPGDLDTDFKLFLNKNSGTSFQISIDSLRTLVLDNIVYFNGDTKICINTATKLIEGYNNNGKTGTLYNKFITAGDFFKIKKTTDSDKYLTIKTESNGAWVPVSADSLPTIEYDYLWC